MSSAEFRGENEPSKAREPETGTYEGAARFISEPPAWQAYQTTQRLIAASEADISVYRFQLDRLWHVAAVASTAPEPALQRRIDRALRRGVPVSLPAKVFGMLLARHREVMATGLPWLEGHYDPGQRLL